MSRITKMGLTAIIAGIAASAPVADAADGPKTPTGTTAPKAYAIFGGHDVTFSRADVPATIRTQLQGAETALAAVGPAVTGGDAAAAASALTTVRNAFASAAAAAQTHVVADDTSGPAAAAAVDTVAHDIVTATSGLDDGVTDATSVDALSTTLDAALDTRDGLLASAITTAADSPSEAGYVETLASANADLDIEDDGLAAILAGDVLTTAAVTAVQAARTQVEAAQTTVTAALGTLDGTPPATTTPTKSSSASKKKRAGTTTSTSTTTNAKNKKKQKS